MNTSSPQRKISLIEILFQILLHIMVFIFYSFEREKGQVIPKVEWTEFLFFLNFALAALIINYFLLPTYLYKKKYWHFAAGVIVVLAGVIFIEEAVIEQIYFPDTRGQNFPGIFYNLASSLPIITIICGFKFAWDALTKQKQVDELKGAIKESELQYLKSQINPHFLFNNLNNLYAYALEKSPKTPEIILELSGVLRYMLYDCQSRYVPLDLELEQLRNFVNLSRLQIEGRGQITFQQNKKHYTEHIAPLILPVFLENAIKHSQSSQSDNILIEVDAELNSNGKLKFKCSNSFSHKTNTDQLASGIGLTNVRKRLEILYPNKHHLNIDIKEDLYIVQLDIDLN